MFKPSRKWIISIFQSRFFNMLRIDASLFHQRVVHYLTELLIAAFCTAG
jgi:hypothetical protein